MSQKSRILEKGEKTRQLSSGTLQICRPPEKKKKKEVIKGKINKVFRVSGGNSIPKLSNRGGNKRLRFGYNSTFREEEWGKIIIVKNFVLRRKR